jgi:hypothetical protein
MVIASESEAISRKIWDCFVAALLAMTYSAGLYLLHALL